MFSIVKYTCIRFFTLSGEANADYHQEQYNCSFPAMIDDWRMAFHQGSGGQTAIDFPFGFVQVGYCMYFSKRNKCSNQGKKHSLYCKSFCAYKTLYVPF